jgi:SAM-dependent methyltransferase
MTQFDEKDLYLGLAAVHWSAISETDPRIDEDFYRQVIRRGDGPALELGCGAGRLLLVYLGEGLDVVGSDISADMLAACRDAATRVNLTPELYEQSMQDLAIARQFATIYIPCGSFVCVMDRRAAVETLKRCHAHLRPGGTLAFNVFVAEHDYSGSTAVPVFPGPWLAKAEKQLPAGRRLRISYRETGIDPVEQVWTEERRYELFEADRLLSTEVHSGQGRWYFRNELLWMLELAGFATVSVTGDFTAEPFGPQHRVNMVFTATA